MLLTIKPFTKPKFPRITKFFVTTFFVMRVLLDILIVIDGVVGRKKLNDYPQYGTAAMTANRTSLNRRAPTEKKTLSGRLFCVPLQGCLTVKMQNHDLQTK